jgi:KaiC/GvpD/RAD55 family RecA-like ATPase
MVSTGSEELDRILPRGYPDKPSVRLVGPPGIGNEAIACSFATPGQPNYGK